MANTKALSKDDRKKSKRTARKKQRHKKTEARDYPRGSKNKSEETGTRHVQAISISVMWRDAG